MEPAAAPNIGKTEDNGKRELHVPGGQNNLTLKNYKREEEQVGHPGI